MTSICSVTANVQSCSKCQGKAQACIYRANTAISKESKLLLLEVISILNSVEDEEAMRKVRILNKETDVSVILSTLREEKDSHQQPGSRSSAATSIAEHFGLKN